MYKVKVKSVPVEEKQQRELKLRELVGKQLSEAFMSNLKPEFETDNFGNIKGICFRIDYQRGICKMVSFKKLFNKNERQNLLDDQTEYKSQTLQESMKGEFMQMFAEDCSEILKSKGRSDYEDYTAIKEQMSEILQKFGYWPLSAMEDAKSEFEQLAILQEFAQKYISKRAEI